MKIENAELKEYGIIFLKSNDWPFNCKVTHVHFKEKKIFLNLQFHYPKKNVKLFTMCMTFKKQNWLKLCYCNLSGIF